MGIIPSLMRKWKHIVYGYVGYPDDQEVHGSKPVISRAVQGTDDLSISGSRISMNMKCLA